MCTVKAFYLWRGDEETAFFRLSQKPLCYENKTVLLISYNAILIRQTRLGYGMRLA